MLASRATLLRSLARAGNANANAAVMRRQPFTHSTWISTPPRTRIPFAEKVAHGLVITAVSLIVPSWVLTHLDDYKS